MYAWTVVCGAIPLVSPGSGHHLKLRWCRHCSVFTPTYHESLLDAEVIVDDFGQGGQAVGGAGGVTAEARANIGFTRLQVRPPRAWL